MQDKVRALRRRGSLGPLIAVQLLLSTTAHAQDDLASRRAAAARYEAAVPISKMMDETIQQMALSLPNDQQRAFVAQMGQTINIEQIRFVALDKAIQVFSAEELDALAAFYGSPVGQSILTKYSVYMAEIIPLIRRELERAARELLKGRTR